MYNQDGFLFSPLKEASLGCCGACAGGLPSPLPCSSPPCVVGLGAPRGEGRGGFEVSTLPTHRRHSAEGPGRARKDGPCTKLHQHQRSPCPKLTHTHLPETKNNRYCIVLLSAVFKQKGELCFAFRDSDCPQLKTWGESLPRLTASSQSLPLCTRWAEAAFSEYKAQSMKLEGRGDR